MNKQPPLTIAQTSPRGARVVVTCPTCSFVAITPNDETAIEITAEVHYITAHGENRTELDWARPWRIAQV